MANRKPFNARNLQLYYNIFHLIINVILFYKGATISWLVNYSYQCQPVDFSQTGTPLKVCRREMTFQFCSTTFGLQFKIAEICWFYYISKFTDFLETFIFILLKRFDMVNLYHVAHHSIMPVSFWNQLNEKFTIFLMNFKVSVWWGVKFIAGKKCLGIQVSFYQLQFLFTSGGHSTFFGFINTAVHVIIYSYLVLTTVYPETKKYFFWWKSFYPLFQIAQFAMVFIHAFQLMWRNDCNYPMAFVYFIGGHAVLFYLLVKNKMVSFSMITN